MRADSRDLSRARVRGSAALFSILVVLATTGVAGEADVLEVKASCNKKRICSFSVTLKHADEGWEHYADQWEVLTPDGSVLGTRVLAHPHVREQPFTRSLGNVSVPEDIEKVVVRARDSVHGYGGTEKTISLPR